MKKILIVDGGPRRNMNAPESMMPDIRQHLAILEGAVARGVGDPAPAFVEAHSTVQVKRRPPRLA